MIAKLGDVVVEACDAVLMQICRSHAAFQICHSCACGSLGEGLASCQTERDKLDLVLHASSLNGFHNGLCHLFVASVGAVFLHLKHHFCRRCRGFQNVEKILKLWQRLTVF